MSIPGKSVVRRITALLVSSLVAGLFTVVASSPAQAGVEAFHYVSPSTFDTTTATALVYQMSLDSGSYQSNGTTRWDKTYRLKFTDFDRVAAPANANCKAVTSSVTFSQPSGVSTCAWSTDNFTVTWVTPNNAAGNPAYQTVTIPAGQLRAKNSSAKVELLDYANKVLATFTSGDATNAQAEEAPPAAVWVDPTIVRGPDEVFGIVGEYLKTGEVKNGYMEDYTFTVDSKASGTPVWSITPALPRGLKIDASGRLTGVPQEPLKRTVFAVQVNLDGASGSKMIELEVVQFLDVDVKYEKSAVTRDLVTHNFVITPSWTGNPRDFQRKLTHKVIKPVLTKTGRVTTRTEYMEFTVGAEPKVLQISTPAPGQVSIGEREGTYVAMVASKNVVLSVSAVPGSVKKVLLVPTSQKWTFSGYVAQAKNLADVKCTMRFSDGLGFKKSQTFTAPLKRTPGSYVQSFKADITTKGVPKSGSVSWTCTADDAVATGTR